MYEFINGILAIKEEKPKLSWDNAVIKYQIDFWDENNDGWRERLLEK